jgi:hypothetical protein
MPKESTPKAQPAVGLLLTALVAVLLAGVATFAGPCSHTDGELPGCLWASRAVLGIGAVAGILAIVRIFETDEGERRGLSLACGLLGFLLAAMPGALIALCADPAMRCNSLMRPFVLCLGIAIGLVGGIDLTRRLLALRR